MPELRNFQSVLDLCESARRQFKACGVKKMSEIDHVFSLLADVIHAIGRLYNKDELTGTKEEAAIEVLIQANEATLAMLFMIEDGFDESSLTLSRNYAELMVVATAIGHDEKCFIDWKNKRSNFNSFEKISKRIETSCAVPDFDKKEVLSHMRQLWNRASQRWSHNLSPDSIRTRSQNRQIALEPKVAPCEDIEKRLNTIRNMLIDNLSVMVAVTHFDRRAEIHQKTFPEGLALIARINGVFDNEAWRNDTAS